MNATTSVLARQLVLSPGAAALAASVLDSDTGEELVVNPTGAAAWMERHDAQHNLGAALRGVEIGNVAVIEWLFERGEKRGPVLDAVLKWWRLSDAHQLDLISQPGMDGRRVNSWLVLEDLGPAARAALMKRADPACVIGSLICLDKVGWRVAELAAEWVSDLEIDVARCHVARLVGARGDLARWDVNGGLAWNEGRVTTGADTAYIQRCRAAQFQRAGDKGVFGAMGLLVWPQTIRSLRREMLAWLKGQGVTNLGALGEHRIGTTRLELRDPEGADAVLAAIERWNAQAETPGQRALVAVASARVHVALSVSVNLSATQRQAELDAASDLLGGARPQCAAVTRDSEDAWRIFQHQRGETGTRIKWSDGRTVSSSKVRGLPRTQCVPGNPREWYAEGGWGGETDLFEGTSEWLAEALGDGTGSSADRWRIFWAIATSREDASLGEMVDVARGLA